LLPGSCGDGIDNDCDLLPDAADPDCRPLVGPTPLAATASSFVDDEASFTDDLLELYFSSDRNGISFATYVSRRTTPGSPWEAPVLVDALSGIPRAYSPRISPDGLTIFFSRGASGNDDLYQARRSSRDALWDVPIAVAGVNTPEDEAEPSVSVDGLEMVISTRRGSNAELLLSTRASVDVAWGTPVAVSGVNTPYLEWSPQLHASGRLLFFKSDRPGLGGEDLYVATRDSRDGPFRDAQLLPFNSTANDETIWVSPDLSYAILSSNRDGAIQLYEVSLGGPP
jgi:hypothetical protein